MQVTERQNIKNLNIKKHYIRKCKYDLLSTSNII